VLQGADLSKELFPILQLVDEKKYDEAIAGYENLLKSVPANLAGPIRFEIASLYAAKEDQNRPFALFTQAVENGFDDCIAPGQYEEWKPLRNDPRMNALFSKMQISEADLKELFWLRSEIEHVIHDTKMMITENTNRMDTGITAIPQSEIPIRKTTSPAVLFNREMLKTIHEVQRYYVAESDKARMEHVGTMGVISGGTSSQEMLESARLADQAADERKRAIQQRRFSLPPNAGTTSQVCSELQK
jgi:hypothetical protein